METAGRLARRLGISRTALLYYDRVGVLSASRRSAAGYRLYSPADAARLEKVLLYRRLGVPLAAIAGLLRGGGALGEVLEGRLATIDEEIAALRRQQQVILRLLQQRRRQRPVRVLDKEAWVALLRAAGLDDADMRRWHVEFERLAPVAHEDFLAALGLPAREVAAIRERSRGGDERLVASAAAAD